MKLPLRGVSVLIALILVLAQQGTAQNWRHPASLENDASSGVILTVAERYLLAAANEDRAARQLPPVRLDERLVLAARSHASEMVRHRNISHRFPGEADLAARANEVGAHFSIIAENVAEAPNAVEFHELWMNSSGHRANLLNPHVDAMGVAIVASHGEFYAVEDFAHLVDGLSLAEQEEKVSELLAHQGLRLERPNEDARETCRLSTGYAGERKPWFVMRYTSSEIERLPDQLVQRIATRRYRRAVVGACVPEGQSPFTSYSLAVLLYP